MIYIVVSNDLNSSVFKDVEILFSIHAKKNNIKIFHINKTADGLKSVAVDIEESGFRSDDKFIFVQSRKRENIHLQNSLTWLVGQIEHSFPFVEHPIIIYLDASKREMLHLESKIDKNGYVDTDEEYEKIERQFPFIFSHDEVSNSVNKLQKPYVDSLWHWDVLSQEQKEEVARYKESIKKCFLDLFDAKKHDDQGDEYVGGHEQWKFDSELAQKILDDLSNDIDSHRIIIDFDVETVFLEKLKQVFSIKKHIFKTLILEYRNTNEPQYDVYLKLLSLILLISTDHFKTTYGWYSIDEILLDNNQVNRKREEYELWLNEYEKTPVSKQVYNMELYDISSIRGSKHKLIVDSSESVRAPWIRLNSSDEILQERVVGQMNRLQGNITHMRTSFTNSFDLSSIGKAEKQHTCQDILNMQDNVRFDRSVSKEDFFYSLHGIEEEIESKNMRSVKGILSAMLNRVPSIPQFITGAFIVLAIMLTPYFVSMDRVSLYHMLHSAENIYLVFSTIIILVASAVAAIAARTSLIEALETYNDFLKSTYQQQKELGERFSKQIAKILSNRASSENHAVYKTFRQKCEAALDHSANARSIQAIRAMLQSIFGKVVIGDKKQKPSEDFFDCQTTLTFQFLGGNSESIKSSGFINKIVLENELA